MKKLLILLLLAGVGWGATAHYVKDPANCPSTDATEFPGQDCSPNEICGDSGGIAQCYDTDTLTAPGSTDTSNTNYNCEDTCDGGYIVNCFVSADAASPYCDNSGNYWCDRNSTCYSTQLRDTTCVASKFGASSCGNCRSDYLNCDTDNIDCEIDPGSTCDNQATFTGCDCVGSGCEGQCDCTGAWRDCDDSDGDADETTGDPDGVGNGCEVQLGVTACATGDNNNQDTCSTCVCDSGYYDCDGGWNQDCDTQDGGSCSVGGLPGTYSCSVGAGGCYTESGGTEYDCECQVDPQDIATTGELVSWSGSDPMLWMQQLGSGDGLFCNFSDSTIFNVNETGAYFDGTDLSAGGGGATDKIEEGDSKAEIADAGTGEFNVSLDGTVHMHLGGVSNADRIYIDGQLEHQGDPDTYIEMENNDEMNFRVGNANFLYLYESGTDYVKINQNSADIDFIVNGDALANLLYTNAGTDRVGIGTDAPTHQLSVIGDVNITDNITIANEIFFENHADCDYFEADSNGLLTCQQFTNTSYVSVTTETAMTTSNLLAGKDMFDEDNYGTYTYTNNSVLNITYTPSDGRFTIEEDGAYFIMLTGHFYVTSSDEFRYIIKKNGADVWDHDWYIHGAVDPVERSTSLILELSDGDYLNFYLSNMDGVDSYASRDGTTISIFKISGGVFGGTQVAGGGGGGSPYWDEVGNYITSNDSIANGAVNVSQDLYVERDGFIANNLEIANRLDVGDFANIDYSANISENLTVHGQYVILDEDTRLQIGGTGFVGDPAIFLDIDDGEYDTILNIKGTINSTNTNLVDFTTVYGPMVYSSKVNGLNFGVSVQPDNDIDIGTVRAIYAAPFASTASDFEVDKWISFESRNFFNSPDSNITNIYGFLYNPSLSSGSWFNEYGIYLEAMTSGDSAYGIWIEAATNYSIVLDEDGEDGGIMFGEGQDAIIYYDGTNLVFDTNYTGGDGYAWFSNNVSASDFFTRTTVWNPLIHGNALDYIRSGQNYLTPAGDINHSSFSPIEYIEYEVLDPSTCEQVLEYTEYCYVIADDEVPECYDTPQAILNPMESLTIPHYTEVCGTKKEQAISMGGKTAKLEQAIYELNEQVQEMKAELCIHDPTYTWCER